MEAIEHRTVLVNGINIHVAVKGPDNGPVILFLHGFPEVWYSWRHQINSLAALGYRAVAPDLRGYGDSDAPADIGSYTCFHIVGDLIALLDSVAADQEKVFVVGHDWGAIVAWYLCLFRSDRVKALVNLSVPFRIFDSSKKPVECCRESYGDDYYMCRFQEPGNIEAEFEEIGTGRVLTQLFANRFPGPVLLPKDKRYWQSPDTPVLLPAWLSEDDVKYYTSKFEKSGFTGGVNYYRNLDINWELTAPWAGCKIEVPVKFIMGDEDIVYHMTGVKDYIHTDAFKKDVPLLEEAVVMNGVAHFLNQEKPDEISQHIYEFIRKFV